VFDGDGTGAGTAVADAHLRLELVLQGPGLRMVERDDLQSDLGQGVTVDHLRLEHTDGAVSAGRHEVSLSNGVNARRDEVAGSGQRRRI